MLGLFFLRGSKQQLSGAYFPMGFQLGMDFCKSRSSVGSVLGSMLSILHVFSYINRYPQGIWKVNSINFILQTRKLSIERSSDLTKVCNECGSWSLCIKAHGLYVINVSLGILSFIHLHFLRLLASS